MVSISSDNLLVASHLRRSTLVDRFEMELNRTRSDIRITKIALGIFILFGAAAVAGSIAATILLTPEFFLIAAFITLVFIGGISDLRKKIKTKEKRLDGQIFSEVLVVTYAGTREITQDKIDVFKKFGHLCKELIIKDHAQDVHNYVHFVAAVQMSEIFNWAIARTNEMKQKFEAQVDPGARDEKLSKAIFICEEMLKLYDALNKGWGMRTRPCSGGVDTMFYLSLKIKTYQKKLEQFKEISEIEPGTTSSVVRNLYVSQNEELRKGLDNYILSDIDSEISKFPREECWNPQELGKVISCCPNLTKITLSDTFAYKELFSSCRGQIINNICNAHANYEVLDDHGKILNPCRFGSLHYNWDAKFGGSFIPSLK